MTHVIGGHDNHCAVPFPRRLQPVDQRSHVMVDLRHRAEVLRAHVPQQAVVAAHRAGRQRGVGVPAEPGVRRRLRRWVGGAHERRHVVRVVHLVIRSGADPGRVRAPEGQVQTPRHVHELPATDVLLGLEHHEGRVAVLAVVERAAVLLEL